MTSVQSPELQAQIAIWRQKAIGGTLSPDEMRQAILLMRGDRLKAAQAPKSSAKGKRPARSADDLLGELENL